MEAWILFALGSAFVFGIKDIFAKKFFQKKDISAKQILFEEYFLGIFLMLLFFFPLVEFKSFYTYYWLFSLKALVIGTSTFLYFELLKKYEISEVSPLLNLSPVFLILFSFFLLGELISMIQFYGILLIILATYFIEVHQHNFFNKNIFNPEKKHFKLLSLKPSKFFIYSTLMLLAISLAAIFDKMILNLGISVYTNLYFTSLLIFIFLSVYFIKKGHFFSSCKKIISEPQTLLISFLTILSNFLVLFAIAIPSSLVSLVVPLRRTSTLFSSLVGGILFHERHLLRKIISILIMLMGVTLLII